MKHKHRIVLLEDDGDQGEYLNDRLETSGFIVSHWYQSESEFNSAISSLESDPPDCFVLDIMVAWVISGDDSGPFYDDPAGPPGSAGVRCAHLLRSRPRLRDIPILFISVLPMRDLQMLIDEDEYEDIAYVGKDRPFLSIAAALDDMLSGI